MTLGEAIDIVFEEAKRQGEPLTRDVCHHIVLRLFGVIAIETKPGDIAKFHRHRYEGDIDEQESQR